MKAVSTFLTLALCSVQSIRALPLEEATEISTELQRRGDDGAAWYVDDIGDDLESICRTYKDACEGLFNALDDRSPKRWQYECSFEYFSQWTYDGDNFFGYDSEANLPTYDGQWSRFDQSTNLWIQASTNTSYSRGSNWPHKRDQSLAPRLDSATPYEKRCLGQDCPAAAGTELSKRGEFECSGYCDPRYEPVNDQCPRRERQELKASFRFYVESQCMITVGGRRQDRSHDCKPDGWVSYPWKGRQNWDY